MVHVKHPQIELDNRLSYNDGGGGLESEEGESVLGRCDGGDRARGRIDLKIN